MDSGRLPNTGHNDGCHCLYKAARLGREHLPSLVLTTEETLAIRHQPSSARPAPRRGGTRGEGRTGRDHPHHLAQHRHDAEGRHVAMLDGYQPGDPMVRVFTYQADPAGRLPEDLAEEAFAICNGHARDTRGGDLSRRYYERELRSLSVGDIAAVGRSCSPSRASDQLYSRRYIACVTQR